MRKRNTKGDCKVQTLALEIITPLKFLLVILIPHHTIMVEYCGLKLVSVCPSVCLPAHSSVRLSYVRTSVFSFLDDILSKYGCSSNLVCALIFLSSSKDFQNWQFYPFLT